MPNKLERLFSDSIKYFQRQGKLLGGKFSDEPYKSERKPADFWVAGKKTFNHVECKETTSKVFTFSFSERFIKKGQYSSISTFNQFREDFYGWIVLSFRKRKLRIDKYYIIHIEDVDPIMRYFNKKSVDFVDLENYNNDQGRVKFDYNMKIPKISVCGVKGRILDLISFFK